MFVLERKRLRTICEVRRVERVRSDRVRETFCRKIGMYGRTEEICGEDDLESIHVRYGGNSEKENTKKMEGWRERCFECLGPEPAGGCKVCRK